MREESFFERFGRPLMGLYAILTMVFFLISVLTGCSKIVSSDDPHASFRGPEQLALVVEAAVTSLAAAADEIEGESFGDTSGTCQGRAGDQPCRGSRRVIQYQNCTLGVLGEQVAGEATIDYSNPNCSLSENGQSAVRRAEQERRGFAGSTQISSASRRNYNGVMVGGGARVRRDSAQLFELHVLGLHKRLEGRYDLSIRSTAPSQISTAAGLLERNGRAIRGGTLEVSHNSSRYTLQIAVGALEYQASCCYPTSGHVNLRYSGSISGGGDVKFTGCGLAEYSALGKSTEVHFQSCE